MRAVVQRVGRASVKVNGEITGGIADGLLVFLGVAPDDTESDADYLADKIAGLRIFEDDAGKMNRSVADIGGAVLAVSQFTLFGDARKGKRPSFDAAARPESPTLSIDTSSSAFVPSACAAKPDASRKPWKSNWSTRVQ